MTRRCFAIAALPLRQFSSRRRQILANMELVMGPLPAGPRPDLQLKVHDTQNSDGYSIRLISFQAEPDDHVPAYLLIPHQPRTKLPAVVCLHQTTAIGKAEPAGLGGKPNLHYAAELARLGFVTVASDYPGFGGYKIDVYARGYASATMKGIVNHMRAVDVLQSLPEVDSVRIGAIGHSLGGHNALFLAAFDERIRAVVTSCGFTSFHRYMGGDLTGWSHRGYMPRIASEYGKSPARMPFDFSDVLEAISPRPVFVNAPLGDSNFDPTGVDEAVQSALSREHSRNRIIVRHPEAGHDFPAPVRDEAYGFLAASLARV
jgi:pimeloyl-ACP methyl ester carboxylesterase